MSDDPFGDRLRDLDDSPVPTADWSDVTARVRRIDRRRRAAMAGAMGVSVAVVAAGVIAFVQSPDEADAPVATDPPITASTETSIAPETAPSVVVTTQPPSTTEAALPTVPPATVPGSSVTTQPPSTTAAPTSAPPTTAPTTTVAPTTTAAPTTTVEPAGVVFAGNGHRYEFVPVGVRELDDAIALAADRGGYVVTITSQAEQDFVMNLLAQQDTEPDEHIFIGASDRDVEGDQAWIDGPEAGVVFWRGYTARDGGGPVDGRYSNFSRSQQPSERGVQGSDDISMSVESGQWQSYLYATGAPIAGVLVEYGD